MYYYGLSLELISGEIRLKLQNEHKLIYGLEAF